MRSSGANASATAIASAPAACRRTTTVRAVAGARPLVTSRNSDTVSSVRPSLSSMRGPIVRSPRLAQVGRPAHADHADAARRHPRADALTAWVVECVTRSTRSGPTSGREPSDDVDDAGRDAVRMVVRRRHDRVGHDGAAFHVEGDGFRERPTDVDADSNRSRLRNASRPTRRDSASAGAPAAPSPAPPTGAGAERRNCGRSTNMYNAPSTYTVTSASLRGDRLAARPVAERLGQEDRRARPVRPPVQRDHVGLLQRTHRVAQERDRGGHEQHDRGRQERLERDPPPEPEDHVTTRRRARRFRRRAPPRPTRPSPGPNDSKRLVEERGLEAFAVDGGEADEHERRGRADRRRPTTHGRGGTRASASARAARSARTRRRTAPRRRGAR